jgi:hypothetical protein
VTTRIPVVLVVTLLSACGVRSQPASAPAAVASNSELRPAALVESNTDDDYVVGPFVASSEDGEAVTTYYIVRN